LAVLREISYSYLDTQYDYVQAGWDTSVTQRVATDWDVRGTVSRYRLNYRRAGLQVASETFPSQTVLTVGVEAGYHFGRSRVGFGVEHADRGSDAPLNPDYSRLRIGSSLTYIF
jgi:hypothetical protein